MLKSQLQIQIILYKHSLKCFDMENSMKAYAFSQDFPKTTALKVCKEF